METKICTKRKTEKVSKRSIKNTQNGQIVIAKEGQNVTMITKIKN